MTEPNEPLYKEEFDPSKMSRKEAIGLFGRLVLFALAVYFTYLIWTH